MPGLPYHFVGFVMQRLNGYIYGPRVRCMKKKHEQKIRYISLIIITQTDVLFVCFVALRPKSTALVIAGRSVHLTTLFSWAGLNKR